MILELGENCNFINGGSWTANEYSEEGHPVLKVSNFNNDSFSLTDISYLEDRSFERYKRHQLKLYDIVVATVGSHPSLVNSAAGRSIVISKRVQGFLLNQNAVCIRTRDLEIIDQRYLGYLCKSNVFQHYIQQRGKGAANQMRIPIGGVKSFKFNFPKIETQRKIATILTAYDDLIENNLRRIRLLEEQARLTYEEWFSVKGLPDNWSECSIGEILEHHIGGGWGKEYQEEKFTDPAYVIRGTDIDHLKIGNISGVPFRWHKNSNLKSRKLMPGDIVFEVSGGSSNEGVAKSLIITKELLEQFSADVMCASFCKLMRPSSSKHSHMLFLFLQYLRKNKTTEIFEKRSASNIVNYNWTAFLKYQRVKIPDNQFLGNFNNIVIPLFSTINKLGQQNQLLREARDLLLPRLMMGVIDVEGVEVELKDEFETNPT